MFISAMQSVRDDDDDDNDDNVSVLVDDNIAPLQRYNSTPDLLDDSRGRSKVAQEVTSPNANDLRSLRDVIVTTKVGADNESPPPTNFLLTARNMLGGSTGNLLDAQRRSPGSSNLRPPPPPARLLSTFSNDQQQTSRSDQDRDAEAIRRKKHGSTGNRLESSSHQSGLDFQGGRGHVHPPDKPPRLHNRQARVNDGSGNVVEPPSRLIQSKRFGSTDNLLDSRGGYGQSVAVAPSNTDRGRKYGQTGMKRYGSMDNLLSDTSSGLTVPAQHQQRLQSDDMPPPPSPATFAGLEYLPQASNDDYDELLQV